MDAVFGVFAFGGLEDEGGDLEPDAGDEDDALVGGGGAAAGFGADERASVVVEESLGEVVGGGESESVGEHDDRFAEGFSAWFGSDGTLEGAVGGDHVELWDVVFDESSEEAVGDGGEAAAVAAQVDDERFGAHKFVDDVVEAVEVVDEAEGGDVDVADVSGEFSGGGFGEIVGASQGDFLTGVEA